MTYIPTTVVTPPPNPVSLAEAKRALRLTSDDTAGDGDLASLIASARSQVETDLNRTLVTTVRDAFFDYFPGREICLPYPPLVSVASLKYTDEAGTEQTFSSALYHVDTARRPGRIVLARNQQWPTVTLRAINGIVIRYTAGDPVYSGTVTTNGTAVSKSSGSDFNIGWPAGHPFNIGSSVYEIASVASASALTLRTTAGVQASPVAYSTNDLDAIYRRMLLVLIYDWYNNRGITAEEPGAELQQSYTSFLNSQRLRP